MYPGIKHTQQHTFAVFLWNNAICRSIEATAALSCPASLLQEASTRRKMHAFEGLALMQPALCQESRRLLSVLSAQSVLLTPELVWGLCGNRWPAELSVSFADWR